VSYENLPDVYNSNAIFVNATTSGSFDKVIFEAMSSGKIMIASNAGYRELIMGEYRDMLCPLEKDAESFARSIEKVMALDDDERKEIGTALRDIVIQKHSLSSLVSKLKVIAENHV